MREVLMVLAFGFGIWNPRGWEGMESKYWWGSGGGDAVAALRRREV